MIASIGRRVHSTPASLHPVGIAERSSNNGKLFLCARGKEKMVHKRGNIMRTVTSKDGTSIAFDQSGQGLVIILVAGATASRLAEASLAATLAPHFTVLAYDRRGRGESGDTAPYAVLREIED